MLPNFGCAPDRLQVGQRNPALVHRNQELVQLHSLGFLVVTKALRCIGVEIRHVNEVAYVSTLNDDRVLLGKYLHTTVPQHDRHLGQVFTYYSCLFPLLEKQVQVSAARL